MTLKSPSEDLYSITQDLHRYGDTEKPKSQKQEAFNMDLADLGVPTDEDVAAVTTRQKVISKRIRSMLGLRAGKGAEGHFERSAWVN